MNNTTTTIQFEITTDCTCMAQDENGEWTEEPSEECYGYCWEMQLEDFTMVTEELWDSNVTKWWKVEDLTLWNGNVSGYFYADTINALLDGMTVNSAWTMRGTAYADRVEYSLSHHDAMGSNTTLTAITEDEMDELGIV